MPVQQHVLNWLYSVLTSEYHDVNRTYGDVAHVLTHYSTLTPRTDVHTFPDGASALLLHISGTMPVLFRGTTYRFPVSIWVPHAYPREAPLIYVTPTDTMMVRPGQHVDPQGRVYHPYLAGWPDFWDKSTILDFLSVLRDVFAKEPPVVSKKQGQAPARSPPAQAPPVPPLPPEMAHPSTPGGASSHAPREARSPPPPPLLPPKPFQEAHASSPPLPPPVASPGHSGVPTRYESVPPLPTQAQAGGAPQQVRPTPQPQFMPPAQPPPPPAIPPQHQPHQQQQYPPQPQWAPPGQGQWQQGQGPPPGWERPPPPPQGQPRPQPPPPPPAPPPPSNLLDDSLALDIPTQATAAPPIPPNPEKDALLQELARTLASMRQSSRQQNESSMAGLAAQRTAMLSAMSALQGEMNQLTQLAGSIASNSGILHDALRTADSVIEGSRGQSVPDIDELLVAPTVVSNQLYRVVAEERALGDAIFMLGRAVERGRISPAAFAKMTRSLAREWYLKKALARKIAKGMGLIVGEA